MARIYKTVDYLKKRVIMLENGVFVGGIIVYKLCKTEQSAARQRQLELGLLEAMGTHHYEQITVSDLCDWMQVPRKSFYRYFSGKDGALHALIDHTLMEYSGSSGYWLPVKKNSTRRELEELFGFWKAHKQLLDALSRSGLSGVLIERAIGYALDVAGLNRGEEQKTIVTEQEHATVFTSCGLMSMIVQWHHSGYALSSHQMALIASGILTKPLLEEI